MKPQTVLFCFALVTLFVTVSVSGGEGGEGGGGGEGGEGGGGGEGGEGGGEGGNGGGEGGGGAGGSGGKGGGKGGKGKPEPITCTGTYKMDTDPADEKFGKYLAALGVSAANIKKVQACKKILIAIRPSNATHHNVEKISKKFSTKFIFQSGKEFEVTLPDGTKFKNTITVDKATKTAKRVVKMNGVEAKQDIKFFDKGFAINMKAKDVEAVLRFSKLTEGPIDDQKYDSWLEDYKKRFFKD